MAKIFGTVLLYWQYPIFVLWRKQATNEVNTMFILCLPYSCDFDSCIGKKMIFSMDFKIPLVVP